MSLLKGFLDPETLKGIIVIFLIVLFATGKGFRIIGNLIRRAAEGR